MKTADLRTLPAEELQQKLQDALDELANLRIQKATHQLSNPSRIKEVRRQIAQYRTLIHEERLGIRKQNVNA